MLDGFIREQLICLKLRSIINVIDVIHVLSVLYCCECSLPCVTDAMFRQINICPDAKTKPNPGSDNDILLLK